MRVWREWILRLWNTIRPARPDAELERELRAHLEMAADAGGRPGEGVAAVAHAMEALRDQRGVTWLEDLARDVRYGVRMLASNPGFTLVCVVSLAIGIGANCAVFSFADALLLRPLTVPRPTEVVTVGSPDMMGRAVTASYRDYVDIRDRSRSFEGLSAFTSAAVAFSADPRTMPAPRIGLLVSDNFFDAMHVQPALGRLFRPDEHQVPGRDAVVILGYEFWTREFARDPSVLGRRVRLNGNDFTIIGVAAEGFTGLDRYTRFEFYAPLMMWQAISEIPGVQPLEARDFRRLTLKGRLKERGAITQAQSELSLLATDLARVYPDSHRNFTLLVRSEFKDRFAQNPPNAILIAMLTFLAASVLFVACANVAGLIASRAPTRAREIAMRLAIGAGRGRVVRQLVTESLLVALGGGALGLAVGYAGVLLFRQFRVPTDLPIEVSFRLDTRAMIVSLLVAVASAILFGVAPAIRATRADLTAVMKATDAAGFGRGRRWGRSILVGGQVAISVVVLAIATFIYRDFEQRLDSGPGFRRDHLLLMWFDPGLIKYTTEQSERFYRRLTDDVERTPGLTGATLTAFVPIDGGAMNARIVPEDFTLPNGESSVTLWSATVDEHFFSVFDVPILAGRGFAATDDGDAPRVAVVNEQFAKHYWPGEDAVGKHIRLDGRTGPRVEIVGVARTVKYRSSFEKPADFVYLPVAQHPTPRLVLLLRSSGDPRQLVESVERIVHALDANMPISDLRTYADVYRYNVVEGPGIGVEIVATMGAVGLMLAVAGLYGLVAYSVSRRTREIGIRIAIGASPSDVLRLVMSKGLVLVATGVAIGQTLGLGLERLLNAFLFDAGGFNLLAYAIVVPSLLAVTMLATYVPARRASRIAPTQALRYE